MLLEPGNQSAEPTEAAGTTREEKAAEESATATAKSPTATNCTATVKSAH